jgi:CBS-domain-containing membrane protein
MRMWRVEDVMTVDVVSVTEDTPYRVIVDTLTGNNVSAVPVVDEFRNVTGVVSEADLLHKVEMAGDDSEPRIFAGRRRRSARAKAAGGVARDLMSAPAISVRPGTPVGAAAKLMEDERVKRLPVTDSAGQLVGIVSRADLLKVYLRSDDDILREVTDEVLHRTLWVDPDAVRAAVDNGVVTLSGRADRRSTAELAVKLTRSVAGVVDVVDRLGFEHDDRRLTEVGYGPFGA